MCCAVQACAQAQIAYNSCRNRHCPKCQASAAQRWLEARQADLLPVEYYHVVFTLPAPISAIAYTNKEVIYGLLFDIAAETLRTIAADPKHLGAQIGATLVLHTWGSALTHHPHVHGIVPGGGLAPDGERWVACRPGFFLPVRVLSRLFRRRFLEELAERSSPRPAAVLRRVRRAGRRRCLRRVARAAARVRMGRLCQAPVRGTRGGARLSVPLHPPGGDLQPRLVALDERGVTFRWKDYREHGTHALQDHDLGADEFMRRFLLHVLPRGFHRIRHYGLLANANRKPDIATARELLHQPAPTACRRYRRGTPITAAQPTFVCRHCGAPMIIIETFARAQHIRGPPRSSAAP